MLIGESGDTQAVCLRPLGYARPIHVRRYVSMPDLLERRIKISMARAHLNGFLKFGGRTSVIDRDDVATLQVRCEELDPIKRRLVKLHVLIGWSLNENKFIAIDVNKFLPAAADQAHRHRVQQFVGKMDTHEGLQRIAPFNPVAKRFQSLRLSLLQNRKWLDYSVAQGCEEFGRAFLHRFENVARELAIMRALLDNHEVVGFAESKPDFGELSAQQLPEQRADTHVGEIIAFPSNRAASRGIVPVLGMVERLLHEPGERLRTAIANLHADEPNQG